MQRSALTPEAYIAELEPDRQEAMVKLREIFIRQLVPLGFEEVMSSGMIGFVVPYSLYPQGYHCKPKQPLPFMGLASQKNFIAIYHMGIYADPNLLAWFEENYPKHTSTKLDMGKSCIRFKKVNNIPYELLEALAQKITVAKWICMYEEGFKPSKKPETQCDLVHPNGVKEKKLEVIDEYTIKYHANGTTMWSKGKMVNDQPEGYWEWYRPDGTLKRSGYFEKGEPIGEWTTYDNSGVKYKTTERKPKL